LQRRNFDMHVDAEMRQQFYLTTYKPRRTKGIKEKP